MSNKRSAAGPSGGRLARRPSAELRRAYEYLSRIDVLESALSGSAFCDVSTLVALALNELAAGRDRDGADLLSVAEHLCFAAQAPHGYAASAIRIFDELRHAIAAEFDALVRRADIFRQENCPRHGTLPDICARTLDQARDAYQDDHLGRALEFARAAELLSEITARTANSPLQRLAS